MKKPILETYFYTSQNKEFADLVASHLGAALSYDAFYHIAYIQTEESKHLVFSSGTSDKSNKVVRPNVNLSDRISQLKNPDLNQINYILLTYNWPEFNYQEQKPEFNNVSNPVLLEILQPTRGYLFLNTQLSYIYSYFTGADEELAKQWVRNWNKKQPMVIEEAKQLFIDGVSLYDYIVSNQTPVVFNSRMNEAKSVLKYCF